MLLGTALGVAHAGCYWRVFLTANTFNVPATRTVGSGAMTPTCEESQGGEQREP